MSIYHGSFYTWSATHILSVTPWGEDITIHGWQRRKLRLGKGANIPKVTPRAGGGGRTWGRSALSQYQQCLSLYMGLLGKFQWDLKPKPVSVIVLLNITYICCSDSLQRGPCPLPSQSGQGGHQFLIKKQASTHTETVHSGLSVLSPNVNPMADALLGRWGPRESGWRPDHWTNRLLLPPRLQTPN